MTAIVQAAPAGPVAPTDRIGAVDIARGFALIGVLAVNMLDFSGPVYRAAPFQVSTAWWDQVAELFIRVLGEGAFYSIFSFLFGLGFALQRQRATERATPFAARFARRLGVLGMFGALHAFLIWEGDILLQYAMAGFCLLLFSRTSAATKLRWCIGLIVFTLVTVMAASVALAAGGTPDMTTASDLTAHISLRESGTVIDLASDRLDGWIAFLVAHALPLPGFIGLFLAGAWVVERGKLANWRNEGPFLGQVLRVSIPVALAVKGLFCLLIVSGDHAWAEMLTPLLSTTLGGVALGATYLCLLLLALQKAEGTATPLSHLAPVGRMALSNYLAQSIVGVALFYGFGFGLYGQLGTASATAIAACLFVVQVIWSRWWLQHFRFGPLEWVWRALTYGQLPRLRSTR